jgi:hypothetical protein
MSIGTRLRTRLAVSAALVATFGCFVAPPSYAVTWEDLAPLCQRNQEACALYVTGIIDALLLSNAAGDGREKYCPPEGGISNEAGIALFRKWLSDHPETAAKQTAAMVHLALTQAYPCH